MANTEKESAMPRSSPLTLLQTPELCKYILKNSVLPRESTFLKELRDVTAILPQSYIATAPETGQLIALLLKITNAKKTIEVGVFTGYSLLLTALTIPHDGMVTAIDIDREAYEIGLPIIKKANVEHKINFIESPALSILDNLLEEKENEGSYDFAYVDADEPNYKHYHERIMKLIKFGGIIAYDNTLLGGFVVMTTEETMPDVRKGRLKFILEFNEIIAADAHLDHICVAPLGYGITICRRVF